jgi:hypothetical protein
LVGGRPDADRCQTEEADAGQQLSSPQPAPEQHCETIRDAQHEHDGGGDQHACAHHRAQCAEPCDQYPAPNLRFGAVPLDGRIFKQLALQFLDVMQERRERVRIELARRTLRPIAAQGIDAAAASLIFVRGRYHGYLVALK